ncbi:hypothetical protein [Oscillatoria acuminata]|uniref:Uncharacterized protein n=1 Tax=Oscillatoria acuminata PCC 6304 TaxID=56110 RepID=K9TNY5_9CYAN|nr:hypothetical protein [Oscillatoria acuminata]AFY84572.1 hypothetical protein Oscil6304_5070 [Oscillatoria acuminata PCC 6304]
MLYSKMLKLGFNELSDRLSFNGLYHFPIGLVSRGILNFFEDRSHPNYTLLAKFFQGRSCIYNLIHLEMGLKRVKD